MKTKYEIVLKALIQGREIKFKDLTYPVMMLLHRSTKSVLCYKYTDDIYPICEMTIGSFIDLCDTFTEDEIVIIAADNALNDGKSFKGGQQWK